MSTISPAETSRSINKQYLKLEVLAHIIDYIPALMKKASLSSEAQ